MMHVVASFLLHRFSPCWLSMKQKRCPVELEQGPVNLKKLHHAPFFQNGAKSGFEMRFGPSTLGVGRWGQNASRIQNEEVHATLRLQAPGAKAGGDTEKTMADAPEEHHDAVTRRNNRIGLRMAMPREGCWREGTIVGIAETRVTVSYDLPCNDIVEPNAALCRMKIFPQDKVRAKCPENAKSDGEILGFVAGRTELEVLFPEEGVWRKGMVVKMNGTITAVAFEADGMVETLNMDLLGDRTTHRVTRRPAAHSYQHDDGWDEENHLGDVTSREFGRRRAFSITQTPDTPRNIKKAHKREIFHTTLHREGHVIIRSAVPIADYIPKIMTAMDKTSLFNHSKQKNEDVPDDRKRRTRVLGMVPTPDMPEELAALQNAVTDIMEEHSVIWDGGRFVSVWSILESVKGCQQQRHHTDFAPEDLNDLDTTEMPLSMIVAVQDGAKLCIWDDEHRHARSMQKGDAHDEFEFGAPRTQFTL